MSKAKIYLSLCIIFAILTPISTILVFVLKPENSYLIIVCFALSSVFEKLYKQEKTKKVGIDFE